MKQTDTENISTAKKNSIKFITNTIKTSQTGFFKGQ